MKNWVLNLFVLLSVLSLVSCGNNTPPPAQQKKITEIKNINFFLDKTASMGGYFNEKADFINNFPIVLVGVENINHQKPIKIYYISDSIELYKKSTEEFNREISTIEVTKNDGYPIHKMFQKIIENTNTGDISIFVSDCILSFSNNEISKNRELSKEKVGELESTLFSTFAKAKNKDICATVFRFNSSFYGKYYSYDNSILNLKGDIRPYYFWVIGNRELVKKFDSSISSIRSFQPEFEPINFGIFEKATQDYKLLFNYRKDGDWDPDNNNVTNVVVNSNKNKSISFAIAVDLSNLPSYAQEENFLNQNLHKNEKDAKFSVSAKKITSSDISKSVPNEKTILQNATHIFTIKVADLLVPGGNINFIMPVQHDTTYYNWSTIDDKNLSELKGKTFAFKHLVDGFNDAYENKSDQFINISLTIKK